MTQTPQMPPARRRPIPGVSAALPAPPPPNPTAQIESTASRSPSSPTRQAARTPATDPAQAAATPSGSRRRTSSQSQASRARPVGAGDMDRSELARRRRPAADYAATRLVNFRLPVDLHDRYKQLVRDAEQQHSRLRHPSFTELLIALLEEGAETGDEVADNPPQARRRARCRAPGMNRSVMISRRSDGSAGRGAGSLSYRVNYGANYRVRLCSPSRPRPRQHWVLALLSSPTTRPPRGKPDGVGAGSRAQDCACFSGWRGRGQTDCEQQTEDQSLRKENQTGKGQRQGQERQLQEAGNDRRHDKDRGLGTILETGQEVVR